MKLLVSVVSAAEAALAVAGGADIIDVKDPLEGALGAPAPRVLAEVVQAVGTAAPVSVALGDLPALPHSAALAAHGAALTGASYVKVGLRRVGELDAAAAILAAVADAVQGRAAVIAAAYADGHTLQPSALAPALLPALVRRTGISGALVDTFVKDGRGVYGWLSESELAGLIARTRGLGATFAVAGQLRRDQLRRVDADVVGVRSAVCRGGDRTAALDQDLVAAAVAELRGTAAQPGTIRVPDARSDPGPRTTQTTPVRRTASGR